MQGSEEQWQTRKDEPVKVNQRALIHKVLARYSGEFTIFRELLQNSDDAQSHAVEIRFETAAYLDRRERKKGNHNVPLTLPDLSSTPVTQWSFKNNGEVFSEQDWMRLPKIAEGNPDPEKIGAFGVGFYSLFSVTERPFVSSGGQRMQFYWKDDKDQLYVRRCYLLQRETLNPWTTFGIPLREASPMPPALEFMRFLASSITFMINLREVGVFFDEHCIGCIKKLPGNIRPVVVPRELKCSSSSNIMNVEELQCHPITIEAEVMRVVYTTGQPPQLGTATSPHQPRDSMQLHRTKVDLTVFTVEAKVGLDRKLSAGLFRSMKKEPPSRLKYSLIYTGKEEYDRSVADQNDPTGFYGSVFQGLRADLKGAMHTRIFIGHTTGQTTGIGGHMASRFIPTVERESIDLVDENVAVWNKELLYVGGFLSRAVYELELSKIRDAWERAVGFDGTADFRPPAELQHTLHQWFLHVLKFFTFHHSTPSAKVARLLETAFYGCSADPVRLLSSTGVRFAPEIKEYGPAFAKFLKYVPMLPQYVIQECPGIIEALPDQHKMSPVTFLDVLQDLRKHSLTREELIACCRWWMSRENASLQDTNQLLSTITICGANGSPLQLSSVNYFIGSESLKAGIPLDGPHPASLMPLDITTRFTPMDPTSLGWQEFTIVDWFRHISQQKVMSADSRYDFTRSIEWAERVLSVLSGVWSSQSDELYHLAKTIFTGKKCIPTSHGLLAPEESFFSSTHITLFQDLDLPTVRFITGLETKGDMELLLTFIGVKKIVPPQLLLDRMVRTGNWSIPDLIRYLVSVQNTLTPDELLRLESFTGFTEEGTRGDGGERPRYRAIDLYPPLDIFRQLQLPVIDWDEIWQNESDQATLLYHLGLRHYPPLEEIVRLSSAAPDVRVRETAFKYLYDNLGSKYSRYNPDDFQHIAFIPAENEGETCLAKLGDVFFSTQWKALGFAVIPDKYQNAPVSELGVQQHPPPSTLIRLLETKPPINKEIAREWFECLYGCISSFSQMELTKLIELPIVPTRSSTGWKWMAPTQCYLNKSTRNDFHAKLFVFVDFGYTANCFLRACRSKDEPSVKDIAEILVDDPKRFYDLAGGHEGFLAELRDLAFWSGRIPNLTLDKMMSRPILLGIRRKKSHERGEYEYEHVLREPGEIVVADDIDTYQLFEDEIFVAPQDVPELEEFYVSLGCRRLSTIVEEKYNALNEIQHPNTSTSVRTLILQRLPLFLHGYNHTQFQIPVSLLRAENFKVKVCKGLVVSKTLKVGNSQMTRSQDVWAATQREEEEWIELWVSVDAELDMYEIATSLCRLLFGTVKASDTLLLATILSAPLEKLKQRGYSVDNISSRLRQPPEDSQLTEEVIDTRCVTQAATTTSVTNHVFEQSEITIGPGSAAASAESSTDCLMPGAFVTLPGNTSSESTMPLHHSIDRASNSTASLIQNLIHRFVPRWGFSETIRSVTSLQYSWTPRLVMPQSYIRANVSMAMNACKPEGGKLLHQHSELEDIREFPNTGYCDVSGRVGNLEPRGEIEQVKIFTTEDVLDPDTFMDTKHDVLVRFVDVLTHVAELNGLSLTVLHVFCDVAGGPIAFNRNGSIFLNLRYFEAWHDQDVQNGDPQRAQISWYVLFSHRLLSSSMDKRVASRFFTLAHELAHNLIKEHNSEHEFWFAAICEAHVWQASKRTLI
ncbi:hypothetical protein JVT61DRAFT_11822 [Boletus reticuloceps]|uniref:Sacsin/Nov domain-containing protein n=1 Tax=Boletus reticuloceps TaxID=495285 RepID=A0A8I2YU35_9AGAM|nr:hypothetical protein JVT61DRAFT_11822 [Boletus reticuloceps]